MICALEKPIERLAVLAGREAFVSIVSMKVGIVGGRYVAGSSI